MRVCKKQWKVLKMHAISAGNHGISEYWQVVSYVMKGEWITNNKNILTRI